MESIKTYNISDLVPSSPVHPGEIVKDALEARGISQRKFAMIIDSSYTLFNEILNRKRPMTTDYALPLESPLGIKAYMLVNMQSEYNLQTARQDSHLSTILSKIRSAAAMLQITAGRQPNKTGR